MNYQLPIGDGLYISPDRPNRSRIQFFVKNYPYIVGVLISSIVLVSTASSKSNFLLGSSFVIAYWVYVSIRLRFRGKSGWVSYYRSIWAQFIRALLLIFGITGFLYFLYYSPIFKLDNRGSDTLWVLYLLAIFIMSQRGSTSLLILSLMIAIMALFLVDPGIGHTIYYIDRFKPITFELISKAIWLALLALILYIFLRYMSDTIADIDLIIGVQERLRRVEETFVISPSSFDERTYLEKAVEMISADLGYDHVNIFRLQRKGDLLECVAAACDRGKKLVQDRFALNINEQSIIGYVAKNNRSYLTNDVLNDANYLKHPAFPKTRAEMGVPIHVRDRQYGVLDVQTNQKNYLLNQDLRALEILANHIGWVLDNGKQFENLNLINETIENIAEPIFTQNDLEETLQEIAEAAKRELDVDLVVVYSYDANEDTLLGPIYAGKPFHPEVLELTNIERDSIVYRLLSSDEKIYLFEDLDQIVEHESIFQSTSFHQLSGKPTFVIREDIRANAIIPLMDDAKCVGVLFLNFREPRSFSEWDKKRYFLFAHLAALAIQKMQFYQRMIRVEMIDIASKIHDTLIGDTVGLYTVLEEIRAPNNENELDRFDETLQRAKIMTDHLYNDIRYIDRLLKEDSSGDLCLEVDRLALIFQQIFRVKIDADWEGEVEHIPPEMVRILRFIIREAFTNSVRHGKADRIQVIAQVEHNFVKMRIQDNGRGFLPERLHRFSGLTSMKNRILRMGGDFRIDSKPNLGTVIELSLPISLRQRLLSINS
jgi:signal transduction histidine kinase